MKTMFSIIFLFISVALSAQTFEGTDLPYTVSNEEFMPLRSRIDTVFQNKLTEKLYENKEWRNLLKTEQMAIGVVDISDSLNIKFARINGNVMMYAASLPKIAILLAVMDAIEKKEVVETEEIKNDLKIMIDKSDNHAATRMIDLVGYDKIENVLKDPKYELYDEEYGGGLWVGKRYAQSGDRNPDPLQGLSHAATVSQVCRFYYLMAFGRLISHEKSLKMLDLMVEPRLHHKFVKSLDELVPDAIIFRKSGTWREFHSDSMMVWGPKWRRYILVGIIADENGSSILTNIVPAVEEVLQSMK